MRRARGPAGLALALLLAFLPASAGAATIRGGLTVGARGINDSRITAAYHPGVVATPYLEIVLWKGFFLGASLETSAAMNGVLGLDQSPAAFQLTAFDLTAGWEIRSRSLEAYLKAGCGFFHYRQTVDDAAVRDMKVDATSAAPIAATGLRLRIVKPVFLSAEIKFVTLKVRPFDQEVDLGGWRFAGGLGFAFDF